MFDEFKRRAVWGLWACGLPLLAARGLAGDWPQILGPDRSGKAAADEKLAESWPAGGPRRVWSHQLGSGYAGPVVVGWALAEQRVIVFHRQGDREIVEALDARTGQPQWSAQFEATYAGGYHADTGPRCAPLVADGKVYVYGAAGDLRCVSLAKGEQLWERSLLADYAGPAGYFGAGSTPILVGGRLIVNVGGRGAGLVALDPATGKTAWKATDEDASYSSPAAVEIGGKEQALFITRYNCVLADPASGAADVLFPFGKRGPTVNAAMPLVFGGKLFVSASYGIGARVASLNAADKPLWSGDDTLSSQYATPVEHQGILYGTHGREDIGVAELRSVEAATGNVRWSQADYGVANLILADGKLLIVGAQGRLALARATPDKYQELATHQLAADVSRALPALAAGRLYVRTGSGGGQLVCYEVGR